MAFTALPPAVSPAVPAPAVPPLSPALRASSMLGGGHFKPYSGAHGSAHVPLPGAALGGIGVGPSLRGGPSLSGTSQWESLLVGPSSGSGSMSGLGLGCGAGGGADGGSGSSLRSPSLGSGSLLQPASQPHSRSPGPRHRMVQVTRSVSPGPNSRALETGLWSSQPAFPAPIFPNRDRSFSPDDKRDPHQWGTQHSALPVTSPAFKKAGARDSSPGVANSLADRNPTLAPRRPPVPVHTSSAWDEHEAPAWGGKRIASPATKTRDVLGRPASPASLCSGGRLASHASGASGTRSPPHTSGGTSSVPHWTAQPVPHVGIPRPGDRSLSPSCTEAYWASQQQMRAPARPIDRSASPASHRAAVPIRIQPASRFISHPDAMTSTSNLGTATGRTGNSPGALQKMFRTTLASQEAASRIPSVGSRSPRSRAATPPQWGPPPPPTPPRDVASMQLPQPFPAQGFFGASSTEASSHTASSVRVRSSSASRLQASSPKRSSSQLNSVSRSSSAKAHREASPIVATTQESSPREEAELRAGSSARIGETVCNVTSALGMGSFGAVWAAEGPDGSELAVKEIVCRSHSELLNALFESHLLRVLGGDASASNRPPALGKELQDARGESVVADAFAATGNSSPRNCSGLVPSLVACGTCCVGNDTWRVRLAMTRIAGEPLDVFLEDKRRRLRKEWREIGGSGGAGAASLARRQLSEACFFARELLVQLVPAFEQISDIAFHRDVNSHNILIDHSGVPGSTPQFGLVDFGLAVDSICWRSEEGTAPTATRPSRVGRDGVSTWHYLDVGGDCRYWPLSAWMQFLAGWRELEACPSLSFEYQTQLDLHAMGITVMQVLAEMLPLPPDVGAEGADGTISAEDAHNIPAEIWKLRLVWDRYWGRVSPLHGRLIDTFHNGGDWNALKLDCINTGVHDKLAEDLRILRVAIRDAHDCCRASLEASALAAEGGKLLGNTAMTDAVGGAAGLAGLLAAMLVLVSDGQGEETLAGPHAWQVIRSLIGCHGDRVAAKPCTASNCSTASTVGCQVFSPEAPEDGRLKQSTSLPYLLLPRPRRISQEEGNNTPRAITAVSNTWNLGQPAAVAPRSNFPSTSGPQVLPASPPSGGGDAHNRSGSAPRENLVRKLSDLKDKVDWLAQEMAKLGEKRDESGNVVRQPARRQPDHS